MENNVESRITRMETHIMIFKWIIGGIGSALVIITITLSGWAWSRSDILSKVERDVAHQEQRNDTQDDNSKEQWRKIDQVNGEINKIGKEVTQNGVYVKEIKSTVQKIKRLIEKKLN